MKTIRINEIFVPVSYNEADLKRAVTKRLSIKESDILDFKIAKKSIDARKKDDIKYVFSLDVSLNDNYNLRDKKSIEIKAKEFIIAQTKPLEKRPVVVGFGPAGMFASLILAEKGERPIIIERGSKVEKRLKDKENLFKNRILNTECNIQFGEGGAGTFSDGKLGTGIKDLRIKKVFEELVEAGAPNEILYEAKPHIGTDILPTVVKNIREKIIKLGGEFYFDTKMTDLGIKDGKIVSITAKSGNTNLSFETDNVILALGHSARDSFEMLCSKKIVLTQKAFSVGARIEHRAEMINKSQYGNFHHKLPTADYKLFTHLKNGRTVYTFCMCPGGHVVAATSEENAVVTNGMSEFARDAINSNSAVLVSVDPKDFPSEDVLSGMYMQRELEKKAFIMAGSNYNAPCQRFEDFLKGVESKNFGDVQPSYEPGVSFCNMKDLFPSFVYESMSEGVRQLSYKLKGFDMPDALLTGPETRSSSPVRILRDDTNCAINIKGLYPCGEGAGYAGGITSAAVDGIRCAQSLTDRVD